MKLAWRNLWRQKRRTLLTASALAMALVLSLVSRCLQEGSYNNNIDNAARFSTGLIQLQNPEFKESLSIDDLLPGSSSFIDKARQLPDITWTLPRIESFALAAGEDRSKGVIVMGVIPELEDAYAKTSKRMTNGEYLKDTDNAVLISDGLARFLQLKVDDELVLYGQGYRGQTAAGLYKIKGILTFPVTELNSRLVYMPLSLAQKLFSTGDQVTSWVLHTDQFPRLTEIENTLSNLYPEANVRDWKNLSPELAQQILMDRAGALFMMYLLYGVVGFGLFATLLMMTLERQREFGVMLATGMVRSRLQMLICIESVFIGALGVVIGLIIAVPLLAWLYFNPIQITGETAKLLLEMGWEPIMPVLLDPNLFINQIIIVLSMLAICLIYPLWRIHRLELVSALKGGAHVG